MIGLSSASRAADDLSQWKLPPVPVPKDNPQSKAKIDLGRQLAFDTRLSKDDALSCADCHLPAAGGGGPTPRAFGHGGELGRWAPSWVNSGYYTSLFWDGRAASLEEQTGALPGHMGPITAPGEMGGNINEVVGKLNAIPAYKKQFNAVFGSDATPQNVAMAIAAFERTLVAKNSPFQRYVNGDKKALTPAAKRGLEIFRGKAACITCHAPPLLSDNAFHNIGVPQVGPLKEDLGHYEVTKDPADKGKFKTPSLYNSGSFAFSMHDGAFATLQQVVEHYNMGGDPKNNPNQDSLIFPLNLSKQEQADLAAFLESLTDESLNQIRRPELP
ncbi:MAG TPA: cytochrome c peroxidase [Burkholderiales bacterium]|nr:cytochrome c peroxidase [Burkholderiales bacterium]